jgi:beta-lactamase regulating signal transducer with metallopeptidase domain
MASLMSYCLGVALLMSLAAFVIERLITMHGRSHRIVWVIALTASLAYPAVRIFLPPTILPVVSRPAVVAEPKTSADVVVSLESRGISSSVASPTRPPAYVRPHGHFAWPDLANWNRALKALWIGSTIAVLAFYLLGWIRLRRMTRHWPIEQVDGASVRVADDVGPAVIGFLKPTIVLPRWLLGGPTNQRAMALAHESEHIAAHDPRLLHLSLLLVALAPWNLPLWWQLRRLRFAIEVDCDRRVLQRGTDAKDYGEMLLSIGQRQRGSIRGVLALTERASQLERRIRVITGAMRRHTRLSVAVLIIVSISLAVAAQQIKAPNINLALDLRKTFPEYAGAAVDKAREISRTQFPELFTQRIDGTAVVVVVFNHDGTLFQAAKKQGSPEDLPDMLGQWAKTIPLGAEPEDIAFLQINDAPLGPWADSQNPFRIVLVTKVLNWPVDATRSASRVRQAVQAYFHDFTQAPAGSMSVVNVFMNEDGTVNRGSKDVLLKGWSLTVDQERFSDPTLTPMQIGRSGLLHEYGQPPDWRFSVIRYAWPRRADDPPAQIDEAGASAENWWWTKEDIAAFHKVNQSSAELTSQDDAILAKYFPDALVNGLPPGLGVWVLLARDGHILGTGTDIHGLHQSSSLFLQMQLDTQYPGLRATNCDQIPPRRITATNGQHFHLTYACVAPVSALTHIAGVEPPKDADLFIDGYVDTNKIRGPFDRKFRIPYWWKSKFGQVARSNFGRALEMIATDVGSEEVELKVRQQIDEDVDWSEWTPAMRVRYGEETDIQIPGPNGSNINLDLRPIRLRAF